MNVPIKMFLYASRPTLCPRGILPRLRRSLSSSEKPFYLTTPIFYVNAKPHVGHLYTLVLTDVIRRYQQLSGRNVSMLTGTDEHGMKIQAAALAAGMSPQRFCDQVAEDFRALPHQANVQYDEFIRTTSPAHKKAVAHFWNVLKDKGYIYEASHSGWYSISDETFFPDSAVTVRKNTETGQDEHHSVETGNVVTWTEETNYHFRLSAFRDRLLDFYRLRQGFITPKDRYADIVKSVTEGLNDLSVSRPSSRLSWGIAVPDDPSQTIYVWLDALVNYITAAGYPNLTSAWPADVHVIGKDIMRFHCIYWPAFLMAAELPLPTKVVAHAHWTMGNHKISKSRGNVVDPWAAIDRYGVDTVRYYLMRDGRLEDDVDYSTDQLILRHNTELVNGLGVLVSRVLAKRFKVDELLSHPPPLRNENVLRLRDSADACVKDYQLFMAQPTIYRAVAKVIDLIKGAHAVLQQQAPWAATCSEEDRAQVMYTSLECARIAALLWQPIMPEAMSTLLDRLGVAKESRTMAFAQFGADKEYRPVLLARQPHTFSPFDDGRPPSSVATKLKIQD